MPQLELTRPDDWHVHLRDGAALKDVAGDSARRFARAIVMPNLKPPVTTTAAAYRARILSVLPAGSSFEPLLTLYLTDSTPPVEIQAAGTSGFVHAVKYYPQGAATNSDLGVTSIQRTYATLVAMAEADMPLLVHGEVTDPDVDVFDREAVFIDRILVPLVQRIPALRVVFEHVTARAARVEAATAGSAKFFLGTDSAPHGRAAKIAACGCAGIYSACAGIELYAAAFEDAGALDKLEGFASRWGAQFYRLPVNTGRITLRREPWRIPQSLPLGEDTFAPPRAGQRCRWRLL